MRAVKYIFLMIIAPLFINAQYHTWPVKSIKFTGNYGELRPNHFHAGLDFSGNGLNNIPIYAVKSGYVSRIKVSPYGYGKVIYISHYDGKLSVYAHQTKFNDSLESYVRREQFRKLSYEVELFPEKNELQISEGELIGFMGNTGGSTGPHLHFEIRDEITEIPLNPLLLFKYNDTIKPNCTHMAVFSTNDSLSPDLIKTIKIKNKNDSLYAEQDTLVFNQSNLAFGFSGYDLEDFKGNPNNIYEAKLCFDDSVIYHHRLNYIPFDVANYINEFSIEVDKRKFQKCFVPVNYPRFIYNNIKHSGRIELTDTAFHTLHFEFKDEAGNSNSFHVVLKTKVISPYIKVNLQSGNFLNCRKDFLHTRPSYTLTIPAKSTYNNGFLKITEQGNSNQQLNITLQNSYLRFPAQLDLPLSTKQLLLAEKIVVKNNNSVLIPKVLGSVASVAFKQFGTFEIKVDTIGPNLKPKLSLKKLKQSIKTADHISFVITDNLSGILNYQLYLNDKWVLAEYDAKSDILTYNFDNNTPTGELEFILTVKDKIKNISVYKLQLKR